MALIPEDRPAQIKWLEEHRLADYLTTDKNGYPAIAIYVNPVWAHYAKTDAAMERIVLRWAQENMEHLSGRTSKDML